jgi:hypothetical protein
MGDRKRRMPKCTKRMHEIVNAPPLHLKLSDDDPNTRGVLLAAKYYGVSPEELLLYHQGTRAAPGIATRFRRNQERDISNRLGRSSRRPFRFDSEEHFRWFVTKTELLWQRSGANISSTAWFADNWLRGFMGISYVDYLGEITACMAEYRTEIVRLESAYIKLAGAKDVPLKVSRWREELSRLVLGLRGRRPCHQTIERWLRHGTELREKPGWHLRFVWSSANAQDNLQVSLRRPCSSPEPAYSEIWVRRATRSGAPLKEQYWVTLAEEIGLHCRQECEDLASLVRDEMRTAELGGLEFRMQESTSPAIEYGPFPTRESAVSFCEALQSRDWATARICRHASENEDSVHFVILNSPDPQLSAEPWTSDHVSDLRATVDGMSALSKELGAPQLLSRWGIRIGPYRSPEEYEQAISQLRQLGFGLGTVQAGERDAEQRFSWPAGREQFRSFHRRD